MHLENNSRTPQLPQFPLCTPQFALTTEAYEESNNHADLPDFEGQNLSDCTPQLPQFLTTKEVMDLIGLSRRSVRIAVEQNRLEVQRDVAKEGHRKNSQINLYPIESVFALWPKAKLAWEAQNQLVINNKQAKDSQREALQYDLAEIAAMPTWKRNGVDARNLVLADMERLAEAMREEALLNGWAKSTQKQVIARFVDDARCYRLAPEIQAALKVANARAGQGRTISEATLKRWLGEKKTGGMAALAPKTKPTREPAWARYFLPLWQRAQKPSILYIVNHELPDVLPSDITPPLEGAVYRYLAKLGEVSKNIGRMLPHELRSKRPYRRRDTESLGEPLAAITADGHTFDAMVMHPITRKAFRPEITTVLDIYTRRLVGISVWLAESAVSSLASFRGCFINEGIPSIAYLDNGSGFNNARVDGVFARLGIKKKNSIPYNSQARGLMERGQKTIWIDLCAKKLSTYIGADMDRQAKQASYKATRKNEKGALPTWSEFSAYALEAIDIYNNRPHRGLPKFVNEHGKRVHYTPNQYWQAAVDKGWVATRLGDDHLDEVLPAIERRASRGMVELRNIKYYSRALEEYHGLDVMVAYDPFDPRRVWVRDKANGAFICVAEADGNVTDYFSASEVGQAMLSREQAKERRALATLARNRDLPIAGLSTLEMAERLEADLEEPPVIEHLDMSIEKQEAIVQRLERADASEEPDLDRYHRLLEQETITHEDREFMERYETTPKGKAMKRLHSLNIPINA